MIIDELTLHNFGLFKDRQTLALTPSGPDKPVVVIGGLNGGGKTTILDALQLCLYGPHAKVSNRGPLGYHEYLGRSIHRSSDIAEAAIQLRFRHWVDGAEDRYVLTRSWRRTASGCKEIFEVIKNDVAEAVLAENWASQVDDFIPSNIAHLFLFDGEQVEAYASHQHSSSLIASAIQSLLGLDIVDQLEKDLQVVERRARLETTGPSKRKEIAEADTELRMLRDRIQDLRQRQASMLTHELDPRRTALDKANEEFRQLGGGLIERESEIYEKLAVAENSLAQITEELREFANDCLPIGLVLSTLDAVINRVAREADIRRARILAKALAGRDRALLRYLKKHDVDDDTLDLFTDFIQDDAAVRKQALSGSVVFNVSEDTEGALQMLRQSVLGNSLCGARDALERYREALRILESAKFERESIPSSESVESVVSRREALRKEIAELEARYDVMTEEIALYEREVERKVGEIGRSQAAEAEANQSKGDNARILRHSLRIRKTLFEFRVAVTARHVRRIEQLVFDCYRQLLRKKSLVSRLEIDPTEYRLSLYGRDGSPLSPERLSAGERQLLAIAILWGLAKASGRVLPTAIDTPLGRLDAEHRRHMVDRYLPVASHQTILLSTDEEISGEYLRRLKPRISHSYLLEYDDRDGASRLTPGYFACSEVA